MKRYVRSSMTPEELVDAVYNNKPYDIESYNEYVQTFRKGPDPEAIKAQKVRIGDIIKNTESAEELDLGDVFKVKKIEKDVDGWDYVFTVRVLTLEGKPIWELHYEEDEYVGIRINEEDVPRPW